VVLGFWFELEFGNVGFWGEGKTEVPGEKPLKARTRTNNKLNPHMTPSPGVEPGPHWWEASALTTAPSLLAQPTNWTIKQATKQAGSHVTCAAVICNLHCFVQGIINEYSFYALTSPILNIVPFPVFYFQKTFDCSQLINSVTLFEENVVIHQRLYLIK